MERGATLVEACEAAGVLIVTGDTKVVNRGSGDKVFINTSGIGRLAPDVHISVDLARPGDLILVSGTIADHGMAVMSTREGLELESTIMSDTAPLHDLVAAMLVVSHDIHSLRDPTRGGIAGTLNELATQSQVGMTIDETAIPIKEEVKGLCELLGIDPLYVANEGKLIAIVQRDAADVMLARMLTHPLGRATRIIGEVVADHPGMVVMKTKIGGTRIVDLMMGEQLPRIC